MAFRNRSPTCAPLAALIQKMAEHGITPAGPRSRLGIRNQRPPSDDQPPQSRFRWIRATNLGPKYLNWHHDLDREAIFEQRKLISQLCNKQRQIAELNGHLLSGTSPSMIKASVTMPVPESMKAQLSSQVKELIREFEVKSLQLMLSVRKRESEQLESAIESVKESHQVKVERRQQELRAANIIHPTDPYDLTDFLADLDEDGRKTRLIEYQADLRKKQKREALAAKKAAEQTNQTLHDPEMSDLKDKVDTLEKKLKHIPGGTPGKAPAKAKPRQKAKPKKFKGKQQQNDVPSRTRTGSKNGHGPGQTGRANSGTSGTKKTGGGAGVSQRR